MREWQPGQFHIGFNISIRGDSVDFGSFREKRHDLRQKLHGSHNRKLIHYDAAMHAHRAIYFPSGEKGHSLKYRLITHFYSYLYHIAHHHHHHYLLFLTMPYSLPQRQGRGYHSHQRFLRFQARCRQTVLRSQLQIFFGEGVFFVVDYSTYHRHSFVFGVSR